MIAGWLFYVLSVSALLVFAAASLDALLTARGRAARWVWTATIAACLAVPIGTYVVQSRAAAPSPGIEETRVGGLIGRFPGYALDHPPATPLVRISRPRAPEWLAADRPIVWLAIACVLIAAIRIAFDSFLLYRGRRSWSAHVIDDVPVLVSDDLGPAIVGLLHPKIVMPRWVLALDRGDRDLMLAHEREHLRAGDGRLTTIALLAVAAQPWNPGVWYALRRLRTAIEVDCDRRVLRQFPDVARYGHLLVDVAQRATGSSLAVAGFSERAAPLARRIQAMTTVARPRNRSADVSRGLLGAGSLAAALVILPPTLPARSTTIDSDIPVLAQQTGDSIAESRPDQSIRLVAAAQDLPAHFAIGAAPDPADAECPEELLDERDGTRLRRSTGRTGITRRVERGDTTWTRQRSVGFYFVRPVGRYGVDSTQLLRVGCGAKTAVRVSGKYAPSRAMSTLDTPDDHRARDIAATVFPLARVKPIAVDLFAGRLDVVFGDTTIARTDDAAWDLRTKVVQKSREILGAALPETVTVSFRTGRDNWMTLVYYKTLGK